MYLYAKQQTDESEEDETIIDLSGYSTAQACFWLLYSLNCTSYFSLPYTIPFCNYVMSWHRCVPLSAILFLQSPYPRNIFPRVAAAMSYDTELCKQQMEGREMPPTIQVLTNDLYINGGMEKEDSVAILKNGWALVDKGILLVNEAVFYTHDREQSYIESAKQCSVIIRLLRETEKYGKRTVDIYAFGEVGEKVGSNLCSWYKSSTIALTKRKVTHPAGVARRFKNLDDPDCHMNTPSFSKSLVKCFRNHVAFMHMMAKKSDQEIKYQQQSDILKAIYDHFPTIGTSLSTYRDLQKEIMESDSTTDEHKSIIKKLDAAADDLITRFRIAGSIVNNMQTRAGTISSNVSRSAPFKSQAPSGSALSEHVGQDPVTATPISSTSNISVKPIKNRKITPSAPPSSFTEVTPAPSVTSINTAPSVATQSSQIKVKPIKSKSLTPNITPIKKVASIASSSKAPTSTQSNSIEEHEAQDTLSPLANKFKGKMKLPQVKQKITLQQNSSSKTAVESEPFSDKKLSKKHIVALSAVSSVVEAHKSELTEDDDENIETIQNDIQYKTIYNGIVERLVAAINTDIENIPDFDFINWAIDGSQPSATFDACKEEFEF